MSDEDVRVLRAHDEVPVSNAHRSLNCLGLHGVFGTWTMMFGTWLTEDNTILEQRKPRIRHKKYEIKNEQHEDHEQNKFDGN